MAECMIQANHWVARKIQEAFPHQALLRRHPPPRQEFFSQLVDSAVARGFSISTGSGWAPPRAPPCTSGALSSVLSQLKSGLCKPAENLLLTFCFYLRRSNKELAESLDRAVDPQDPLVNRLLRMMATSAMSQALYFSTGAQAEDQYYHYGTLPVYSLL